MRLIDADALIQELENSADYCKQHGQEADEFMFRLMISLLKDEAAPTFAPPNELLTLEQLWEMDGEPVWDEDGKCYLVDTTFRYCSVSDVEVALVDSRGMTHYPCHYKLYRRPPEGETHA